MTIAPAETHRAPEVVRMLVVDDVRGTTRIVAWRELPSLLRRGDVVVLNDAATLPASLRCTNVSGQAIELRLVGQVRDRREGDADVVFTAALLGAGDHRTRTEDRAPPPPVHVGERLSAGALVAEVLAIHDAISARLVDIRFDLASSVSSSRTPRAAIWAALYRIGRPIQYAHVASSLALWDVQNVYAGRPWAVEMPSAGRYLRGETIAALRRRGVEIARVTHAAGLSAVGDSAIDAALPLPERFEVPRATVESIARARRCSARVVAIGTSVVRALESAAQTHDGKLVAASGITALKLGPASRRAVVDAVLTGIHDAETTHHALLGAFASSDLLERARRDAERQGLLGHELGDVCLIWGRPVEKAAFDGAEQLV